MYTQTHIDTHRSTHMYILNIYIYMCKCIYVCIYPSVFWIDDVFIILKGIREKEKRKSREGLLEWSGSAKEKRGRWRWKVYIKL